RVARERRRQLEAALDPVQPGGDKRRDREVWIAVAARNARLDARTLSVPDDAETARPVVVRPRERRRSPRTGRVALVRVDVRRKEERELLRARDPAGEPLLEHLAPAGERILAVAPERAVDVARVADPCVIRLRHEGD